MAEYPTAEELCIETSSKEQDKIDAQITLLIRKIQCTASNGIEYIYVNKDEVPTDVKDALESLGYTVTFEPNNTYGCGTTGSCGCDQTSTTGDNSNPEDCAQGVYKIEWCINTSNSSS